MSTISIVGAGNIARAVATRALAAGYDVQIARPQPGERRHPRG